MLPDLFRSGCTHFWHSMLTMYGFCQFIQNSKLSSIFSKHMWGQILRLINTCLYFIIIYIYLLCSCQCVCLEDAHIGGGKVVIPVDTQRVHHFSRVRLGGMMNHVYLQELQSGPSCVASSAHSMLGWVIPLWFYCKITTKGFTLYSSLFMSLPPSVCQVLQFSLL